jgi:hypothetical protein
MRNLLLIGFVLLLAVPAFAVVTVTYGWEDGGTVLGMSPANGLACTNVAAPDPVYAGLHSLKCNELATGTKQAYVAWIRGLVDGSQVHVELYAYDTTVGVNPSGRIWAHYNDSPTNVMQSNGSASGPNFYSGGTGWTNDVATNYTWTMAGGHTGIVIEFRCYGAIGDNVWADEMTITAPDGATIVVPEPQSPVENGTWSSIKALYR